MPAPRPARARPQAEAKSEEALRALLARLSRGVERYHAGLFDLSFKEALRVEDLREDMTAKRSREYVFESLVVRESLSADASDYYAETVRRLKSVDGRAPKKEDETEAPADSPGEFLNFLLPRWHELFEFTPRGEETVEGRRALKVEFLRPGEGEPSVEWEGDSFRVAAPKLWTLWADAETFDVLRVESHLAAPFDFENPHAGGFGPFGAARKLRYARADYAARFRRVQLADTKESLLVPDSAEWLTVIEGARRPRTRATVRFSDFKRFRSGVKVVEDP